MLGIFTIIFSITIVSLTATQSVVLAWYVLLPLYILVFSRAILRKKLVPYSIAMGIAIVLAWLSVQVFFARHNSHILSWSSTLIQTNEGWYSSVIAHGTVQEKQTHNRYLRKADNGTVFFLYSEKSYNPGDYLLLTAAAQPSSTQKLSLFTDHNNKKQRFLAHRKEYNFDFQTRQIMKGVGGSLYDRNSIILEQNTERLWLIARTKSNIQASIYRVFGQDSHRWLIAGMLLGDRSLLPADDYQLFIDSGIVHIIAVSGAHMITVVLFLQLLLFFLPFYMRIAIIIPCIIAYGALCGLDGSVLRAVIMGTLSLLALFRWKQTLVWRSLLIAFVSMLLVNPFFLVYDIWFIFSFAAVIGIVYMGSWTKELRLPSTTIGSISNKILHSYVFPSLGASMMIAPFLLFFTGKFNLIAIIANILIFPFIPFVMIGWALTTALQTTVLGVLLHDIVAYGIEYLYIIASLGQDYAIYIVSSGWWFMYTVLWCVIVLVTMDRLWLYTKK